MQSPFSSRAFTAMIAALAALLVALAVIQYRWTARVAAADEQREREHLESSAALVSNEFNTMIMKVMEFAQNDAWAAFQSGQKPSAVPKIIGELYYVDRSAQPAKAQVLNKDGAFVPAAIPEWMANMGCTTQLATQPPALVSPVLKQMIVADDSASTTFRTIGPQSGKCFVARLNEGYLRNELFPQLMREGFGETASEDYDFAVVVRDSQHAPVYGAALNPDVTQPLFSLAPTAMRRKSPGSPPVTAPPQGKVTFFIQRFESTVVARRGPIGPGAAQFFDGIWELQVAHKSVPLATAIQRARIRNLFLSLGLEALVFAAMVTMIIAVRRTHQLADQKMQFVAAVSHELRTPVSAISMLSRNQADGLVSGPKVKEYGELIHRESRRLNELVEQTLEYAGIGSGLRRNARNEVDLSVLIEDALQARHADLMSRGFEVDLALASDLPPIIGDAKLLRTAFDNLLSNALKYAESGHWMRVSAMYSAAEKEVLINVEDRGPGIAVTDQAEIFEPFCRGQAAVEAQIEGSGLGLSLVRSAAEAHRGTVTLVSELGRGSTFTMHLPL